MEEDQQAASGGGGTGAATIRYSAPKLNPPDKFDFTDPGQWSRWRARWRRYREASGLHTRPEKEQINTLIYAMGEQAEDVLLSRGIDESSYAAVLVSFDTYFGVRRNLIAERATFNRMCQVEDSMDIFVHKLYRQAEYCEYGDLREQLIRDRIVVGVADDELSTKLQAETELTLDDAVRLARLFESAKLARTSFRAPGAGSSSAEASEVSAVRYKSRPPRREVAPSRGKSCPRCGKEPHSREACPATKSSCNHCHKTGHWASQCYSAKRTDAGTLDDTVNELTDLHLGEVDGHHDDSNEPWMAQIRVCSPDDSVSVSVMYKLDSGAAATVCGPSSVPRSHSLVPAQRRLFGPGSLELPCLGKFTANLRFGDRSVQESVYVVRNQRTNLLSKRACSALGLLQCTVHNVEDAKDLFEGLGTMSEEYDIPLRDDAQPFAIYVPRPVPLPLLEKTKQELERMLSMGVIGRSTGATEWCSPMVVIPKKDTVRICSDVTQLNKFVRREVHPMPTVDESLAKLHGSRVFSKLDANSGFWQIPLSPASQPLTTFLTPFGRYHYKKLMFGLCSAPEIFCREMSRILEGCEGISVHMDDILVMGADREEHDRRLKAVLGRIRSSGMTLNPKKCEFGKESVVFLGYKIDRDGIHAGDRIQGIRDFALPRDPKDVQSFLGLVNQYSRFSPHLAELSTPLRALLVKDAPWIWLSPQQSAFEAMKKEFASPPVLGTYDVSRPTVVSADASSHGIGAVLTQTQADGTRRLIAAASRSLSDTEQRYAVIEKEALAVTWALEKFSRYVLGMTDLLVETDHKPLVSLLGNQEIFKLPARILRFRLRLMRFTYTIRHIPGKSNIVADALSRNALKAPTVDEVLFIEEVEDFVQQLVRLPASDVRLQELRRAQKEDEVLCRVSQFVTNGWPPYISSIDTVLGPYFENRASITRHQELLVYQNRIIVPQTERLETLRLIHEGHLGITKCLERARRAVWWPAMSEAVSEMVKNCTTCKLHSKTTPEPLRPTATPDRPWQVVGSDLFYHKGQCFLLLVDYYSRYPEVCKLESETANEVIKQMKEVFSRHGIPEMVISDNGPQYASQEFRRFAASYRFQGVTSSPRYPRGNGAAERMVQTVKSILKKCDDPCLGLLAYRSAPLQSGFSPAELLMGRRLRTNLGEMCGNPMTADDHLTFKAANTQYKAAMKQNHDRPARVVEMPTLQSGDRVHIRDMDRPGVVQGSSPGTNSYAVASGNSVLRRNRTALVHTDPVTRSHSFREPESPSETCGSPRNATQQVTRSGRPIARPRRLIEEC